MIKKSLTSAALALAFITLPLSAQQFVNGSLTGPVANSAVPSGWTLLLGSPDTNDPSNNVGSPGNPFGAPASFSPNGGTWVGVGRNNSASFLERFGQTVSGLTTGQSYTVSWYASNFGYTGGPGYLEPNFFQMLLNGTVVGAGASIALGQGWFAQSVSFNAASTSDAIAFQLGGAGPSYMGIDGISLSTNAVLAPEPGSVALVAFGLGALLIVRRGRRAR